MFKGSNKAFWKHDLEITIECEKSEETKVSGAYVEQEHIFKFLIESPLTCWKVVSSYQMVFHCYRIFYFLCFFGVGVFCSLYGMKNVVVTCQIIGFVGGFCLVFTLMSIVFYSSWIIRNGWNEYTVDNRVIWTSRVFYSPNFQALGKSTQLHFQ